MDPHNLRQRVRVVDSHVYLVRGDGVEELCAPLRKLVGRADRSHQGTLAGSYYSHVLCG